MDCVLRERVFEISENSRLLMNSYSAKQFENADALFDEHDLQEAIDINNEAKILDIKLDKKLANRIFTEKINRSIFYKFKHVRQKIENIFIIKTKNTKQ